MRTQKKPLPQVPATEVKVDVIDVEVLFQQFIGRFVCVSACFLHGIVELLSASPAIAASPRHARPTAGNGQGTLELARAIATEEST